MVENACYPFTKTGCTPTHPKYQNILFFVNNHEFSKCLRGSGDCLPLSQRHWLEQLKKKTSKDLFWQQIFKPFPNLKTNVNTLATEQVRLGFMVLPAERTREELCWKTPLKCIDWWELLPPPQELRLALRLSTEKRWTSLVTQIDPMQYC